MICKITKRTGMMLLAMLLMVGCVTFMPSTEAKAANAKITLEHAKASLYTGKTYAVKVKSVRGLKSRRVTFTSNDPQIATVNNKGRVKGMSRGKADITVTSTANPQVKTVFHMTVKQQMTGLETASNMVLKKGKTAKLHYAVLPYNVNNEKIRFKSSNTNIVTVNGKGKLHARKAGKATIYVQSADGKYKQKVKISVKNKVIQEESIQLDHEELNMTEGMQSRVTADITPQTATAKNVYYVSSNVKVAMVNKTGVVTALSNGQAEITAYAGDHSGISASCMVTVQDQSVTEEKETQTQTEQTSGPETKPEIQSLAPVSEKTAEVTVSKDKVSLVVGAKTSIQADVVPATANKEFSWTSSSNDVATVSPSGEITAVKAGRAVITVKNAQGASAQINVQVSVETQMQNSGQLQAMIMESDKDYEVRTGSYVQEYQAAKVSEITQNLSEMSKMNSLSQWFSAINSSNAAEYLLMFGYQPVLGINDSRIQVEDKFEGNVDQKQIVISGTSRGNQAKVYITLLKKSEEEMTIQELVQVDGTDTGNSTVDFSKIVMQSDFVKAIMNHGSTHSVIETRYIQPDEFIINCNYQYLYGFTKENNHIIWKTNKPLYATIYQDFKGRQALLESPIETVLNTMKLFALN